MQLCSADVNAQGVTCPDQHDEASKKCEDWNQVVLNHKRQMTMDGMVMILSLNVLQQDGEG